jgi:hypothetical protein
MGRRHQTIQQIAASAAALLVITMVAIKLFGRCYGC